MRDLKRTMVLPKHLWRRNLPCHDWDLTSYEQFSEQFCELTGVE